MKLNNLFKGIISLYIFFTVLTIGMWGLVIYVAYHFISKWW